MNPAEILIGTIGYLLLVLFVLGSGHAARARAKAGDLLAAEARRSREDREIEQLESIPMMSHDPERLG